MKFKNFFWVVLILVLILISFYFDSQISSAVSLIRNSSLDSFFLGLTSISSKVIIFIFLTGLFLINQKNRKWVLPVWLTMGLSVVIGYLLKIIVQRFRPFQIDIVSILPQLIQVSHSIWNYSFPSFRTMLVFCALPFISKRFPKLKYVWIVFAGLVAFSRIYFGLHFLSDVLAGGLIGYLIGWFVIKLEEEYNFGKKLF